MHQLIKWSLYGMCTQITAKPCLGTQLPEKRCNSKHIPFAGEYPMTGTSAAEKETPGSRADKLHRGRNVVLAFTMQVS